MEYKSTSSPKGFSIHRHSKDSHRNSTPVKGTALPPRRMTIETTSQSLTSSYSPRQSLSAISQEEQPTTVNGDTSISVVRKHIFSSTSNLIEELKKALSYKRLVLGVFSHVHKTETKKSVIETIDTEALPIIEIETSDLVPLEVAKDKETFEDLFVEIEDIEEIFSNALQLFETNAPNSLCPLVMYLRQDAVDRITSFIPNLKYKTMQTTVFATSSKFFKRVYECKDLPNPVELFADISAYLCALIPLFESDRVDVQRKIEAQEMLVQFKVSSSFKLRSSDSISLSGLLWAKSNIRNSAVFTTQMLKSSSELGAFLVQHDVILFLRCLLGVDSSFDIMSSVFQALDEDKIIDCSLAYVKLVTKDGIVRYHKTALVLTKLGLISVVLFSNGKALFGDFITAKSLVNAEIEKCPSQDPTFIGDLHIKCKNENYKKEVYYGFMHEEELQEWGATFQMWAGQLDVVYEPNVEITSPIVTQFNKRKGQKVQKYVGSSAQDLVEVQLSLNGSTLVPEVIQKCVNQIIREGLGVEGLFRKPPDQNQLEEVMKKLNDKDFRLTFNSKGEYPISTLCGLLKSFLMEMNPRFLNEDQHKVFFEISKKKDGERREMCMQFIKLLDAPQKVILGEYLYLMTFIAANQRINRMGSLNLSTAICQCFLPRKNSVEGASVENESFECLIDNFDMFKENTPKTLPSISCLFKRQNKNDGGIALIYIEKSEVMWVIDKNGGVVSVDVNTLKSELTKISDVNILDMKHMTVSGDIVVVGTTSMIYSISVLTKTVIQKSEKKRCSFLTSSQDVLYIGEQNGEIEIVDVNTFTVKSVIDVKLNEGDSKTINPVISFILPTNDYIYAVGVNRCEVVKIDKATEKVKQVIYTPHNSTITCLGFSEESKKLWSGDYNGMICVYSADNNSLSHKFQFPPTFGNVTSLQSIPGYVIATFISSQIVVFSSDKAHLITSASTDLFVSCKSSIVVRRNLNGTKSWNIWMEKDDSGDVVILDVSYPSSQNNDIVLDRLDNYITNKYYAKADVGHQFMQAKTEDKCTICGESFVDGLDCYKCSKCEKHVHGSCIAKFAFVPCMKPTGSIFDVINTSKGGVKKQKVKK
ncbi:hypothetical protein EIN_053970 [Entamoeba invadens IP1]|uniref:hypothetical protein n=1 Tax=Entamoeba invadens IP1 TaxID=370355 RepID=UPI0002C3CEC8|nr:hypothetical protein EIN_053970 [Entamoeba invadens IP1]ELP93132.1 hypothetical protein EIN_053970 [Entamoeba invadens IP1]|eukprot:XP_004259903.1 hypothetical protein EIN_053970 [Entamoeba invadens IP1]